MINTHTNLENDKVTGMVEKYIEKSMKRLKEKQEQILAEIKKEKIIKEKYLMISRHNQNHNKFNLTKLQRFITLVISRFH